MSKKSNLFSFLENESYKLMVDMSKENHSTADCEDISYRFNAVNKREFYEICHEHELDGVVGQFAKTIGCHLPDYWEQEYEKQKHRQEFLKRTAKDICLKLDSAGIPMVILKNGGIMLSMVQEAVKCPMEDIDSLIKKKDFFKAHDVLVENGFVLKFRSEYEKDELEEAFRHGSSEYYLLMDDGSRMWFELSWRAIDGRWIRPDLEPDTDELVNRSFIPDGTKVHVLSPEDNLLQVCIHTAKHSYCRAPGLRLHMDVDRIVSHNCIDWEKFLKKVKESHVRTSTFISLYIPKKLFNTDIPQWVLDDLKPKNVKRILDMLANAGLLHPKERKFSKFQFLRFQTALYDSKSDIIHVIYPGKEWMNERYGCNSSIQRFAATIQRGLDLAGIRKRK